MEKRNHQRWQIEGLQARYKRCSIFSFLAPYSSWQPIQNISRCGICLVFQQAVKSGQEYQFKINLPNQKTVVLKGKVVWSAPDDHRSLFCAGIEFSPFSTLKGHNPLMALRILQTIFNHHS